ncbi:hypothetical protein ACVW16_004111 [Bradyrhizobium sp. USDA 4474]
MSKRCALERRFAGVTTEMNVGGGHADVFRHGVQLVRGVGQLRQRLRQPRAIYARAAPKLGTG